MKTKDVFNYFGGKETAVHTICKLLGCSTKTVYRWNELVPVRSACRLEVLTKGKLKVNAIDYAEIEKGSLSKRTFKYVK